MTPSKVGNPHPPDAECEPEPARRQPRASAKLRPAVPPTPKPAPISNESDQPKEWRDWAGPKRVASFRLPDEMLDEVTPPERSSGSRSGTSLSPASPACSASQPTKSPHLLTARHRPCVRGDRCCYGASVFDRSRLRCRRLVLVRCGFADSASDREQAAGDGRCAASATVTFSGGRWLSCSYSLSAGEEGLAEGVWLRGHLPCRRSRPRRSRGRVRAGPRGSRGSRSTNGA
jgi:hypothetical protein